MNEQEQLILAFMLDLGIVLGAKNEQEALLTGQAAVLKLGENASKLFQAWGQAESQQQGAGKQVIAEALGANKQQGAPAQSLSQTIGSMRPEYNAAPTSTAYAKMGTKFLQLNGHCPEGYEVERFLAGGCVKCRKKRELSLAEEMKCGGKKRISKKEIGGNLINEAVLNELKKRKIEQANKSALDRMDQYPVDKLSINDILANPLLLVDTLLPDNYESLMSPDTNLLRSRALEQEKKQKAILEALLDTANKRNLNNYMSSISFLKCGGKAKKRITKALDGTKTLRQYDENGNLIIKRNTTNPDGSHDVNIYKHLGDYFAPNDQSFHITPNGDTIYQINPNIKNLPYYEYLQTPEGVRAWIQAHDKYFKSKPGQLVVKPAPAPSYKCGGKTKKKKCEDGDKLLSNKCGGKTKKKESGGTLNTEWLNLAKQTNRTMSTLNRFTKLGNGKK